MTKPIEFDVETTGFQAYSGKHYPFSFQFYDGDLGEFILWDPQDDSPEHDESADRIQWWFDRCEREDRGLRAWNSKFDFAFAWTQGFTLPPEHLWMDGMLEAHAINERRSVALKAVASDMFGEESPTCRRRSRSGSTRRTRAAVSSPRTLWTPPTTSSPTSSSPPTTPTCRWS